MQSGKHQGKLVISFRGYSEVLTNTYLLVGGLGGLGRSIAKMLISLRARNLAFISRSGAESEDSRAIVRELVHLSAKVHTYCAEISDETALSSALESCGADLPPIKGIQGTWNLHAYFDTTHPLGFFINLSSISGIIGNKGKANYAAGSTFQEAIAHHRRALGLRGVSLDLGIMPDVGVLAEHGATGDVKRWEAVTGTREPLFHALIKAVLRSHQQEQHSLHHSPTPAQICVGLGTSAAFDAVNTPRPEYLIHDLRFLPLSSTSPSSRNPTSPPDHTSTTTAPLKPQLQAAPSLADATAIVTSALVHKIAHILQTQSAEIDAGRPMYLYGVDSQGAMEVRNWIRREMGCADCDFRCVGGGAD
ncbi:hypothetical protein LEMA_P098040.1 [Plenodomus lingam JN3]|uniref:Uncharacterized protein n=1 Tax=Leptosphaeria maculans (strain JN3 / isolate v23.1.3 / race Av1-4-5-6-7-8) TaxID=985895 RepID=E5A450_LEPMJ|nr:hypothetical protein LEMA_P098040.1 [Plenodomus lingam JN3]CBX98395.1 hypothetical protein LEMA_P098040.1 [Plenodomus lingam JN3]